MSRFPFPVCPPLARFAEGFCRELYLVCLVCLCALAGCKKAAPENAALKTPALAIERLDSKALFYNGAAWPWLMERRADLLSAEEKDAQSERSRALSQAAQSPALFRRLDRQSHFDTLFLVGDPSQSRPLLEHLLDTRDWTLTYLDHTSLIFRRGEQRPWGAEDFRAVREKFAGSKKAEAAMMGQAATKMLALRMTQPAKALLDEAERLDGKSIEVLSALAIYHMNRGEWTQSLARADQALKVDENFLGALATKAQVYYSTKRFEEALVLSRRLIEARPNDPGLLFYHAKIAHERHAYASEVESLKKLIALAESGSRPASGYRIYLGQAYAAQSEGAPAIEQFEKALGDPELSEEQRKFTSELLTQIKKRTGL